MTAEETCEWKALSTPKYTESRRNLSRRNVLLAGTVLAAGSALVFGMQIATAQDQQSTDVKESKKYAVAAAQRIPSAIGYPRPFEK